MEEEKHVRWGTQDDGWCQQKTEPAGDDPAQLGARTWELLDDARNLGQFLDRECLASRVLRAIDENYLRFRGERGPELVDRQVPHLLAGVHGVSNEPQRHVLAHSACHLYLR